MSDHNQTGLEALPDDLAIGISGGSLLTGSAELAKDIGRCIGATVGAYMQLGKAFYRSGGLTGKNPWLRTI